MSKSDEVETVSRVIEGERSEIITRRLKVGAPDVSPENGLVGLSLSGGGLRSACFSIGIVQALYQAGLWKRIDYLSSVSGGGYTAGYLSNQMVRSEQPFDEKTFPLGTVAEVPAGKDASDNGLGSGASNTADESLEDADPQTHSAPGRQSRHVRRLIHSGNYLFRPFYFANRYLFGVVLINLSAFSLMIAITAFLAWLWRCLDYDVVRRNADLLDLDSDLLIPFVPAALLAGLWMISWLGSIWRRNDQSTGLLARHCLYLMIPAFLIGCALVIGNGDNAGAGVERLTGESTFTVPKSIWATVTGLIVAALLPWIRPQRILQSGINPRNAAEKYVFLVASTALLVGVPLLLIGLLARENISGFNDHPHRPMVGGDIESLGMVSSFVMPPVLKVDSLLDASADQDAGDATKTESTDPDLDQAGGTDQEVKLVPSEGSNEEPGKFAAEGGTGKSNVDSKDEGRSDAQKTVSKNADSADVDKETKPIRRAVLLSLVELLRRGQKDFETEESPNGRESDPPEQKILDALMAPNANSADQITGLLREEEGSDRRQAILKHRLLEDDAEFPVRPFTKDRLTMMRTADVLSTSAMLDLVDLRRLQERSNADTLAFENLGMEDRGDASRLIVHALLCSAAAGHLIDTPTSNSRVDFKDHVRYHRTSLTPNLRQWYYNIGYWTGVDHDNDVATYLNARKIQNRVKRCLAESFEIGLLDDKTLRKKLAKLSIEGWQKQDDADKKSYPVPDEVDELVDAFGVTEHVPMLLEDGRRLSRLALQNLAPGSLRPRSEIRRLTTHSEDQWSRLSIFFGASVIFLITGFGVNLNTVSLHRYYRNRIAEVFVATSDGRDATIPLSSVDTCEYGGPYHLISGAVTIWRKHAFLGNGMPDDWTLPETHADASLSLRTQDSFLLSKRFCGSDLTGYSRTEHYENQIPGALNRIDLADAIAISGAAVSPGNVTNPMIAALMVILNLRLGQWLPNPKRLPNVIPTMAGRIIDLMRPWQKRPYFFVTDGGVHENLGLVQLLKRKCRLIFCVDAGCDPRHQFADFAKAMADVRVHEGIRFLEVTGVSGSDGPSKAFSLDSLRPKKVDDESFGSLAESHFKVGVVKYSDGSESTLVFIKPSLTGDESIDLLHYRAKNAEFPHESTSDQFYDPTQVEAYRRLGEHIGKRIARAIAGPSGVVDKSLSTDQLIQALRQYQVVADIQQNRSSITIPKSDLIAWLRTRKWSPEDCSDRQVDSLRKRFAGASDSELAEVLPVVALMPDVSENIRLRAGELLRLLVPMPHDFDPSESTQASEAEKFTQTKK